MDFPTIKTNCSIRIFQRILERCNVESIGFLCLPRRSWRNLVEFVGREYNQFILCFSLLGAPTQGALVYLPQRLMTRARERSIHTRLVIELAFVPSFQRHLPLSFFFFFEFSSGCLRIEATLCVAGRQFPFLTDRCHCFSSFFFIRVPFSLRFNHSCFSADV